MSQKNDIDEGDRMKKTWVEYTLTKKWLVGITVYYCVLLIMGIVVSAIFIARSPVPLESLLLATIIASIAVAIMLCSIQYLKRLYKAAIDGRIVEAETNKIAKFGNIIYFLLRPVYAVVFVILMVYALLGGLIFITSSIDFVLNERFMYFCVAISGIIGFSIGRILDRFEALSSKKVDSFFNIESEEALK
jgi:hypothetical protein